MKNIQCQRTALLAVGFEAAGELRSENSESCRVRSNLSMQSCSCHGRWQSFLDSFNAKASDLVGSKLALDLDEAYIPSDANQYGTAKEFSHKQNPVRFRKKTKLKLETYDSNVLAT